MSLKTELFALAFSIVISVPVPAAADTPLTPAEFEKMNGGVSAELTCFDMLIKSTGQNLASNEKAESILKSVFELKQAVSKDKKAKFSFERIPMFDDVKVDEKMYASIAAYSKTAKELKTTETVIGLQKHVQKETEADLAQAKISFYDDCKKMLLTSLGKCKGFANSTKLLGQCYGRESQAETKRLLDHATGMKTFAARLKTEK